MSSWFTDLADKAENLLNKIDQNAAAVLQDTEKKKKRKISPEHISKPDDEVTSSPSFGAPIASLSKAHLNEEPKQVVLKGKSLKRNGQRALETGDGRTSDFKGSQSLRQTRSAGNFTTITEHETRNISELSIAKEDPVLINVENDADSSSVSEHAFHLGEDGNVSVTSNSSDHFVNMENEMLRNEISVVNNEVSMLIAKARNAEKASEDKQVRLHQVEDAYTLIVKENEILQQRLTDIEKQTNEADLDSSKLSELNESVRILSEDKQNLVDKIKELELSVVSNLSVKSELESDLREKDSKCKELEEKLEKTRTEIVDLQAEWKSYKIRANSTLLMKEKIIEELGGNGGENSADDLVSTLNTQINQLKLERDDIATESSRYQDECDKKSKEIEQLEMRTTSTERQLSALREAFRQEKAAKEIAEHTIYGLSKELKTMQQETAKQISSLRTKIREKESHSKENDKLLSHSAASSSSINVSESGEERFRLLTQALVAKQAALESITSDRNALRLQLEKTENKYRSDLISMKNNQPRIIHLNDTDDVKARLPHMMQENPWDSNLSRGVKKAYSTLDGFSVRIGLFLRRNPIARIFIISYMIILHFWVMIVLFTYTPEIHERNSVL